MRQIIVSFSFALALFILPAHALAIIIIHPPTLTESLESGYANDPVSLGVHPNIGVNSASVFVFKVVYTQTQNFSPTKMNLALSDGTTTTTYPMYLDGGALDPILRNGNYADGEQYVYSSTFAPGIYNYHFESDFGARLPAASTWVFSANADPGCTENCYDNVLFLPGIEASRLYRPNDQHLCDYANDFGDIISPAECRLWEPGGDVRSQYLALDSSGKSIWSDIYTRDVVDSGYGSKNVYLTFLAQLKKMRDVDQLIADYSAIPYDWRLSPEDILASGLKDGDNISYLRPTSTPYIIQELHRLASSSRSGKVTIIAHSNGGIITKALLQKLEDTHDPILEKIDKIIFVAVPQIGTPQAIGAVLHGYKQEIPDVWYLPDGTFISAAAARILVHDMPGAYQLLPSAPYFQDVRNPVVLFDATPLFEKEINLYGRALGNETELYNFLLNAEGRDAPSSATDIKTPNSLNSTLLQNAGSLHSVLDNWTPPSTVTLYQIAGWGVDTVSGISYKQGGHSDSPTWDYDPIPTEDGDGTVVVPSALYMSTTSPNVSRYWVNLAQYRSEDRGDLDHSSILETDELRTFIQNIITRQSPVVLPRYISTSTPSVTQIEKHLRFYLHSPLTLNLYDDAGHHTGIATTTGIIDRQIPGSTYREFGDVKYISVPGSMASHLVLRGYASGDFSLKIEEAVGGVVTASTTFAGIPSSTSTIVNMNFPGGVIDETSPLRVDSNGDGNVDFSLSPKLGDTITLPPPDITPPEAVVTFSTSTNAILVTGIDDQGIPTVSSTTTYPTPKKNQKEQRGIATTTVTIADMAGNTTVLTYTEELPSPAKRDTITLTSIRYNGIVTDLSDTTLKYKWNVNKKGGYTTFAAHLKTATTILESHYRPKKDVTILMTKPTDLDDSEDDGDNVDARPIKQKLPGMVIPGLQTNHGSIVISY